MARLSVYQKNYLAVSIIFLLIIIILKEVVNSAFVCRYIWYVYAYILVVMYLTHMITERGFNKTPLDAQNYFMISTAIKIFCSGAVIFIYFYISKQDAKVFLIDFFIFYFTYTFFEIKSLLLSLQPHSKSDTDK